MQINHTIDTNKPRYNKNTAIGSREGFAVWAAFANVFLPTRSWMQGKEANREQKHGMETVKRVFAGCFPCQSPAWSRECFCVRTGTWGNCAKPLDLWLQAQSRLWWILPMVLHIQLLGAHTPVLTFSSFSILRVTFSKLRQRTTLFTQILASAKWEATAEHAAKCFNLDPQTYALKKPRTEQPSWQSPGRCFNISPPSQAAAELFAIKLR